MMMNFFNLTLQSYKKTILSKEPPIAGETAQNLSNNWISTYIDGNLSICVSHLSNCSIYLWHYQWMRQLVLPACLCLLNHFKGRDTYTN